MKIKISVEGMNVNIVLNKEQINEFDLKWKSIGAVSYTHLTLPTILLV